MRKINFYHSESGKSPVLDFLENLPDKSSRKISWVLRIVREVDQVPVQYLKKLTNTDDIWEIRATLGSDTYRLLCFFDGNALIIVTNGFSKKTNKVPPKEIKLAEERKRDYLRRKNNA
ncbi:MAG: type II toxin-antitoxin system RelE/ParE family toxin [Balneolales bacterium]|nr:type II toxin-antitoxin system RelE/ParE family toxin [Balneolales bacterium]